MKIEELQDGYYLINDKRVLYRQDNQWFVPIKYMGRYSGNIKIEPVNIKGVKTIELFNIEFN